MESLESKTTFDLVTTSEDTIPVGANSFSAPTTIKASRGDAFRIISVAFKHIDGSFGKQVYPVVMAPTDNTLKTWDIQFFNNTGSPVNLKVYGIEAR